MRNEGSNDAAVFDVITPANHNLDASCTCLSVSSSSVYWMHVGVIVPALGKSQVSLWNANMTIMKTNPVNAIETMTLSGVVSFPSAPCQSSVISTQPTLTTNWVGFRIDTHNDPLVAFRLARTTSQSISQTMAFDLVLFNIGEQYETNDTSKTAACIHYQYDINVFLAY